MIAPPVVVRRMRNLKICLLAMLLSGTTTQAAANALAGPPQFAGLGVGGIAVGAKKCEPSVTTASGTHVLESSLVHKSGPSSGIGGGVSGVGANTAGPFCSGDLIFEDTFDTFDLRKWQHESTLAGGSVSE